LPIRRRTAWLSEGCEQLVCLIGWAFSKLFLEYSFQVLILSNHGRALTGSRIKPHEGSVCLLVYGVETGSAFGGLDSRDWIAGRGARRGKQQQAVAIEVRQPFSFDDEVIMIKAG
jgi:hypothetical protein